MRTALPFRSTPKVAISIDLNLSTNQHVTTVLRNGVGYDAPTLVESGAHRVGVR